MDGVPQPHRPRAVPPPSIFALAASGLVLTYTTTGIFNFAHGAIGMLGAFAYWQLHVDWGWPTPLALGDGPARARARARAWRSSAGSCAASPTRPRRSGSSSRSACSWPSSASACGSGRPQEAHQRPVLFRGERLEPLRRARHVAPTSRLRRGRRRGHRPAAAALPHAGRPRHAGLASTAGRWRMLHGARPDRSAAAGLGHRLLAGGAGGDPHRGPLGGSSPTSNLTLLIVNAYAAAMIGRLRSLPMTFVGAVILGLADSYAIGYIPRRQRVPRRRSGSSSRSWCSSSCSSCSRTRSCAPARRTPRGRTSRARRGAPPLVTAAAIVGRALVLASVLSDADALRASKIFGLALIALSLVPLTGFGGQVSLCQMSFAGDRRHRDGPPRPGRRPARAPAARPSSARWSAALVALPALRLSGHLPRAGDGRLRRVPRPLGLHCFQSFDLGPVDDQVLRPRGHRRAARSTSPASTPQTGRRSSWCWRSSFALAYLLVVGVRRSGFGQRLLAMKDSPAACATLGLDVTRLKLGVFALSAAMAGVGGALYAGTLGSVSARALQPLREPPAAAAHRGRRHRHRGGRRSSRACSSAASRSPSASWPFLANLNRSCPARWASRSGATPTAPCATSPAATRVLSEVPVALVGLRRSRWSRRACSPSPGPSPDGASSSARGVALVVWPQAAEVVVGSPGADVASRRRSSGPGSTEPLTAAEVRELDAVARALEDPEERCRSMTRARGHRRQRPASAGGWRSTTSTSPPSRG